MAVSTFDLFKIGIGPSSSHTVGPMRAARMFAAGLQTAGVLGVTARVQCALHGSLGATGKGHGSDKAVILGLCGHEPESVDIDGIAPAIARVRAERELPLLGRHPVAWNEADDLLFYRKPLPFHANGMRLSAWDAQGTLLAERTFYSVGGGFVVSEEAAADGSRHKVIAPDATVLPIPFCSGDEVGCQGEVGVACSMAAAALCAVMGGTPEQVENAAEIGMEHHLGLTCDPVGGLVQIPCIERNAIASVKAINAARMALRGDGVHHVSLDKVIKTMRETGADMKTQYKETSRGGLAVNIVEC